MTISKTFLAGSIGLAGALSEIFPNLFVICIRLGVRFHSCCGQCLQFPCCVPFISAELKSALFASGRLGTERPLSSFVDLLPTLLRAVSYPESQSFCSRMAGCEAIFQETYMWNANCAAIMRKTTSPIARQPSKS